MKLLPALAATAYGSLTLHVFKESGFTRQQAWDDCAGKGFRLANIYNQAEQDQLNAAITAADGLERAFWLGMFEDGDVADGNAAKDSDGNPLRFNGFRPDQPSNRLNHPNDKHTTDEYEDCVRQFGLEGWNDAICSRTWSGAKKHNVAMGHICEERTVKHPTQHTNEFEDTFIEWVDVFLGPSFPQSVQRWRENKIEPFAVRIRSIMDRPCAEGTAPYSGISEIDPSGDALVQLGDIIQDMKDFFGTFIPNCKANVLTKKNEKLDRWALKLTEKFNKI